MHVLVFLVSVISFSAEFAAGLELCKDGEFMSLPNGKYMQCNNGKWIRAICPEHYRFMPRSHICVSNTEALNNLLNRNRRNVDPNNLLKDTRNKLSQIVNGTTNTQQLATTTSTPRPRPPSTSVAGPPKKPSQLFPGDCGILSQSTIIGTANKVAGGEEARIEDSPWQIGIMSQTTRELKCGGTIISKHHVISAAHCFLSIERKNGVPTTVKIKKEARYIFAGATSLKERAFTYNISHLIIHSKYSSDHKQNDIALIKILGSFKLSDLVHPICLPYQELYIVKRTSIVTGWGAERTAERSVDSLKRGAVKIYSRDDCVSKMSKYVEISNGMFCAGDDRDDDDNTQRTDTCQGDSGGPLFSNEGGKNYILGITSWGIQCGLRDHPGVYTKVIAYVDWITHVANRSMHEGDFEDN